MAIKSAAYLARIGPDSAGLTVDSKLVSAHTKFMTTIAEAHASSTAPPSAFFACWADMATWPEWNSDTEWVRLDGPFTAGARGVLKPRGGPRVKFEVTALVPDREFTDVSRLAGARLTFRHLVQARPDGGCDLHVTITMSGPLGWLWTRALGKGAAASLAPDLAGLVAAAEARHAAAATA